MYFLIARRRLSLFRFRHLFVRLVSYLFFLCDICDSGENFGWPGASTLDGSAIAWAGNLTGVHRWSLGKNKRNVSTAMLPKTYRRSPLRLCFQNQIERCLRCAPELGKAAAEHDFTQAGFPGLRS